MENVNPYGHSRPRSSDLEHVLEPLVEWSWSKKKVVPILAESWSNPKNHMAVQAKKGIKFHDGSEFTAADVVHSYTRGQKDPDSKQVTSLPMLTP